MKDSITCGARSSTRRCKKCHNSRRSLRSWYQSANRIQEWENMSLEDRRKLVAKNKHKGAGKGVRRNVIVSDQASCVDSLKLQQDKPFLTKKQFLTQVIFFQAFFGLSVIPQCRFMFTKPPLILIFLKLEKKREKCKKKWKNQKANQQNPKHKSNIKGKKREKKGKTKRGTNGKKMDLSICIFFAFFLLFRFAFCLLFFAFILLFSRQKAKKKQKKSKTKANKKQIEKAKKKQQKCKWTSPFFPIFSPFLTFLCFPIYFASCFFRF